MSSCLVASIDDTVAYLTLNRHCHDMRSHSNFKEHESIYSRIIRNFYVLIKGVHKVASRTQASLPDRNLGPACMQAMLLPINSIFVYLYIYSACIKIFLSYHHTYVRLCIHA